jgi:light-regulated signal transduction histidine kinase (bacteriophytochrome)
MLKDTQEYESSASLAGEESAKLYLDIADGLHAMAQPLTVLLGTLGNLKLRDRTELDHRQYLDMSTRQVDHMCGLLSSLRDLVDARLFEAKLSRIDLWETLAPIVEDHVVAHQGSGVEIRMVKPDHSVFVFGDPERTSQAFAAVLKVAASISSPGDAIQALFQKRDGNLELIVESEESHGKRLGSSDRLGLSSAAANIQSQQGRFECVENPLRVLISLPSTETVPGEAGECSSLIASEIFASG